MAARDETAYIVYDTESVVDGALLGRVLYPDEGLSPDAAIVRYREEQAANGRTGDFIPVSFHLPVAVAVARVRSDYRLADVACLDAPRFGSRNMVGLFWKGVDVYRNAVLVDFNGRSFDIPLLSLAAFRYGISCSTYFSDPDRFGFRYRYTDKHLDLLDWLTEYGAYRLNGGLNLLAKILGKPGKMGTTGASVETMHTEGRLQEINDYCLHDVLDTYFVFLRTRVLAGKISIEDEQAIVEESKAWLTARAGKLPCLTPYVDNFGRWER